ncbi:peptidylprolyl isomerase [Shewanella corallii]|uniref:Peptidyl-prolyl cis-trans isomerase n=2 Tax=Shewanella TaxID=22 RepID=A0ABT0N3J2_9GAMM|nr:MULTISPECIES: peptidylprolyl isomerase [Shewanella]MCL1036390.1 peptidylprolyl isomerase [Shewanella submarina]MCL2912999.1 peptidylprolyl isomerase [Shewanella corallii]
MIENNKVVAIDYSVTDEANQLIDTSEGREPLKYLHGTGNIIPGLEQALNGKQAGDEFEVTVSPAEAYGEHNPDNVQEVPMDAFQGVEKVEVGMSFTAQGANGNFQVTVTNISDDNIVTVDANHPLAGKTLTFKGVVREVRDATEEEIEHGHVH